MNLIAMEYKYHLSLLNGEKTALYHFVYDELSAAKASFEVEAAVSSVHEVIKAILMDNPELFWFEGKWKASSDGRYLRVIPIYKRSAEQKEQVFEHIRKLSGGVIGTERSVIGHIKAVYDWILNNIQYCRSENDQTLEGALIERKAVCKGIAKAFQFFMNVLDIPSFLAEGSVDGRESHVWNIVYVNGVFYHVDVTMGYSRFSPLFNKIERIRRYPCFMVSDNTIALTHKRYANSFIKCAQDFDLNRYLVNELKIPPRFLKLGTVKYLDQGSTCTVFSVDCEKERYALKAMVCENGGKRFFDALREVEIMKRIRACTGVVGLLDYEIEHCEKRIYLLLPYYETLAVKRRMKKTDSVKEIVAIGTDILKTLIDCRNQGVYHMDIQPKNIYVDSIGRALLGDFGEARYESDLVSVGRMHGTLAFMSPEVYHQGIYGQASEIYALGIVLYSLLNGAKLPFADRHDFTTAVRMRLEGCELSPCTTDSALWECIRRMCAFDRKERFSAYEDALCELTRLLA